jgi:hypothetical protein
MQVKTPATACRRRAKNRSVFDHAPAIMSTPFIRGRVAAILNWDLQFPVTPTRPDAHEPDRRPIYGTRGPVKLNDPFSKHS